jgi:hypothetical protein
MSHDRRLYPATDQPLPSADDTSYPTCTTRGYEGSTGQIQSAGVTDGVQPWARFDPRPTSTFVPGNDNESCENSFLDGLVRIDEYDVSGRTDPYDRSWSSMTDVASQARTSVDFTLLEDIQSVAPWSSYDLHWSSFAPPRSAEYQLNTAFQHDLSGLSPDMDSLRQQRSNDAEFEVSNREDAVWGHATTHVSPSFRIREATPPIAPIPAFSYSQFEPVRPRIRLRGSTPPVASPSMFAGISQSPLSPSASVRSSTPISETTTTLNCEHCSQEFSGLYARGNLARHRRLKHKGPVVYECEDYHCNRVFHRQDARTKHYRKFHSHLTSSPAFSRKSHRNQNDYDIGSNTHEAGEAKLESLPSMAPPQYADSATVCMDTTASTPTIVTSGPSTEALRKDGESVRCDICQKEFNRAAELRRHKDSVHNLNPPQYFCAVPGCDRASRPFPRKDKLADHTARVHGQSTTSEAFEHGEEVSEATYRCDYEGCEREFDQRADLLRHRRTHTDESERPHKCAQCDRSFLYPKDLKRHQATHLDNEDDGKPTFHCEITSCEYGPGKQGFSRKDGMLRHMRRFHPELKREAPEDFGNEPGGPFQGAKRARAIPTDQEPTNATQPTKAALPTKAVLPTNRRTGCPGQDWNCKPEELKGRRYWTHRRKFHQHFLWEHLEDYRVDGYRLQCNLCDHDSFGGSGHDLARHLWDTHLQ